MAEATIGADVGSTKLLLVSGQCAMRFRTGPTFSPDDFASKLALFISRERLRRARIGIAVPGLVDASGRVVACDVLPKLAGWSPAETLSASECLITVINDVKAALLEEMQGDPPDLTAGVVMVGTAIGAAFVAHGKPLVGTDGWAGELGYMPFGVDGHIKRLDDVAGGAAMAAKRGVDPERLAELAAAGESESLAVIEAGGSAFGVGLAGVINLLNPSYLAVGGGALELAGYWDAGRRAAMRYSILELWRHCELRRVKAGDGVVALGALRAAALADGA